MSAGARGPGPRAQPSKGPHLALRPAVSYGLVGGRAIFLDAARDRYLALDPEAEAAFARVRRAPQAPLAADFDRLVATRLFDGCATPRPLDPDAIAPAAAACCEGHVRPGIRLRDIVEVWRLVRHARRRLAHGALDALLAELAAQRAPLPPGGGDPSAAALAARFHAARSFVPVPSRCLQDSVALALWLARRGVRPALVLGVKLDPFAAHCWVQQGPCLLNDAPDTVAPFAPVRVLA